jgi:hypothetical protein
MCKDRREKKSKRRERERERESKDKFLATMTGLVFVCLVLD